MRSEQLESKSRMTCIMQISTLLTEREANNIEQRDKSSVKLKS
jgi:hypothetical protein